MSPSSLTKFELERAYHLEILGSVGEVMHFCNDLTGPDPFYLRKPCSSGGGECIHVFNVYHSKNGDVPYHTCGHCCRSIRIAEGYYNRAREIHEAGGEHID